ncbi:Nramp family divalent metal transporter [Nocardiopsis sediminis]|uniref:Nramp family divalent metal transporter n=1 Tax=Nocardiopsis sediminis TaxID=1778267 RepID=A0ABV8FL71_9ACTN
MTANPRPSPAAAPPDATRRSRLLRALALMGPAFVVGAWQFGPGNLTSAIEAGGRFGYALIWVIVVSTLLMTVFTDMSVRIGLASPGSVVDSIKQRLGHAWGVLAGCGVFLITLMFSVGNAVGSGLGLSMLFGGPPVAWTLACTVLVAVLLLTRDYYRRFEKVLLLTVVVMGIGFLLAAILSGPSWPEVGRGVVPTVPDGVGLLLVAMVGTNFSVNAAFYAGYTIRERGIDRSRYRETTLSDTIPGIAAPGLMTIMVIVASAAVAQRTGTAAGSAGELSGVLESVAGPAGGYVFAAGFTAAAFSSMLANATAGGTLLADGLGWGSGLGGRRVRGLILVILGFGLAVAALASGSPVQLIITAQALTVVVAPFLGLVILLLANHRGLMGDLRNRWWHNLLGAAGWLGILAVCASLAVEVL